MLRTQVLQVAVKNAYLTIEGASARGWGNTAKGCVDPNGNDLEFQTEKLKGIVFLVYGAIVEKNAFYNFFIIYY